MVKRETRDERSNEMGLFRKRKPAPKSNPRPGTRISKPVFGCELFVAQFNL
jgi:hypothetical protein